MYMSYCRFEGTHDELRECLGDVDDHIYESAEYAVSDREIDHFRKMVKEFYDWIADSDLITDDGELDTNKLDEICAAMSKSYAE